jgi:ABC-2 type transport system ATP-binding protein
MIIKAENISKNFKVKVNSGKFFKDIFKPDKKEVFAVKDISFRINQGESVAFLGPNGAGKTTTTKMLSGLLYPTEGSIEVMGYEPFKRDPEFLREIGLVMGNKAGLNWDLTPNQSFKLLKQIYKIPENTFVEKRDYLLNLLEAKQFADTQVRKLSLGQRMKMELIGAILHNPKLLFLDEPTIGLDIMSKQKVREFLISIQKEFNTTLLLTSHDMDDIEHVCNRVLIINQGEIILDQSLKTLVEKYRKERFIKFIFQNKLDKDKLLNNEYQIVDKGDLFVTIQTSKEDMPKNIAKIASDYHLQDIDILSIPLEEIISDVFIQSSGNRSER